MSILPYLMRPRNDGRAQYPHNPQKLTFIYNTNLQNSNTVVSIPVFDTSASGIIDWGDGSSTNINPGTNSFVLHTYAGHGIYIISIDGYLSKFNYTVSTSSQQNKPKLSKVLSWGNIGLSDIGDGIANCRNVDFIPESLPTGITDISYLFYDTNLNDGKILGYWQSGTMTTLAGTFAYNPNFDQDISGWNTENVVNTYQTFRNATSFNQNISLWNMSSNTNSSYMFAGATSFNQNIQSWDVSNVTNMQYMFDGAMSFDQNLSGWDISSIASSSGLTNFMRGISLSDNNYDSILLDWNTNKDSYRNDLSPNFGSSRFTAVASGARHDLISYGWIITDGGISS
jgi:surface protein